MRPAFRHVLAASFAAWLAGCSIVGSLGTDLVPVFDKDEYGDTIALETRICRPATRSPAPILVLNHGTPVGESTREDIKPAECSSVAVRWFVARGYVVVLPMRRDYGRSGGDWAEDPGPCSNPDYARAAREAAHDIGLAVAYAMKLPGTRPDGLVVLGWDTGGLGTLAYAGSNPPAGARAIVMAANGGVRGTAEAGHFCRPDLLVEAAGQLGATVHVPTLWVYARNDSVVTPELATAMSTAFAAAGGQVVLEQPDAPITEGHDLFFAGAGPAVWGPLVERFLKR